LLFHGGDQFNDLHDGHFGYCVDDIFVGKSHDSIFLYWGTPLGASKHYKQTTKAVGSLSGSFGFLLIADCSQRTNVLAGGALDNAHQLCDCFVVSRQRSQLVDLVSCKVIAFKRGCLDLELVLALGEVLEQAGSGARMLIGKRDQSRTDKDVVQALVFGTFNSTTQQGVTY